MTAAMAADDLPQSGYYRVENFKTDRYAYIVDNRGSINWSTTQADLQAILLWKNPERPLHDPASVLYFDHISGSEYNVSSQGTSVYDMIEHYLKLLSAGNGTYYAYGKSGKFTKYLGDGEMADIEKGYMCTSAEGDYRKWYVKSIKPDGDNYFGILPTDAAGGKYYATFYAAFPVSAYSSGIKFYYISTVDDGMAVKQEITGTVPAGVPVLVECSHADVSSNRLNLGGSGSAPSGNLLKGVYFNNDDGAHTNRTAYNPKTMRLLGTCKDGSIGFVTSNVSYIPSNSAYITVPEGSDAEFKIVTEEEYQANHKIRPTSVSVTPANASIHDGETVTLTATVLPENAYDRTVTWTSSNQDIATVDANGVVTGKGNGTATITATTVNGLTATSNVTVTVLAKSISVSPTSLDMYADTSSQFTATVLPANAANKAVKWETSNADVATVDENGLVSAVGNGTATITAVTADGTNLSATAQVNVTTLVTAIVLDPSYIEAVKGDKFTISATVYPATATNPDIVWSSTDPEVCTVDEEGNVEIVGKGVANIEAAATDGSGIKGYCRVICNVDVVFATSISVDPEEFTGEVGDTFKLETTILPATATFKEVIYSSSRRSVATVDDEGTVTINGAGECTITVYTTDGTNLTATCHITSYLSGIDEIISDGQTATVYNLQGMPVMCNANAEDLLSLPAGLYIINGKKIVKK